MHATSRLLLTDQGRPIPDVAHPGEFLYDGAQAGVRLRMRTVTRWRGRRHVGPWTTTEAFSVVNDLAPTVRIDDVVEREDGKLEIAWTVFDPDSEDADGDGRLDPGEDRNGNGLFDQEQVGVAFDFHPVQLQDGEDPASMSEAELEELAWIPCTRAAGEGDTDSVRHPAPRTPEPDLRVHGAPGGRTWTFVWDGPADRLDGYGPVVLRARAVDARYQLGPFAYRLDPLTLPE